ncbi:MAG: hypothetical protein H6818_06845 [Phycisphaerales bacterium]|nr:hypothetical protein [Phycisphaerales bacterium]MCB9864874.1 hypothetical protein [Phycisphaerales bacterium]
MTADSPSMKTRTLANWFGSARTNAQRIGAELGKLAWCGVPFCGGCPELPYIETRAGVACDKHRHIINLAKVVSHPDLHLQLKDRVGSTLFHPDELALAQARLRDRNYFDGLFGIALTMPDVEWAADYFIATWMTRGGSSGRKHEFGQSLAIRYGSGGGDSAVRYRSAVDSLEAWHAALLSRWSFDVGDGFELIERTKDRPDCGLYIDAPWVEEGVEYAFAFTIAQHERLARLLTKFGHTRVVLRYGDHQLLRDLYPTNLWTWTDLESRNQRNNAIREVLIINGEPFASAAQRVER